MIPNDPGDLSGATIPFDRRVSKERIVDGDWI